MKQMIYTCKIVTDGPLEVAALEKAVALIPGVDTAEVTTFRVQSAKEAKS